MPEISPLSVKACAWLNNLAANKRPKISLFLNDFKELGSLIPVQSDRVIDNSDGEAQLIVIDRQKAIDDLRAKFEFRTISEVTEELQDESTL